MTDIFEQRRPRQVPVWFMRQAGRYHQHYQNIKRQSDFMSMCKDPELACEITLGPIQDFGFDAAILFSDLLFPLEHLGMGLHYNEGPPRLAFHLQEKGNIEKLAPIAPAREFYAFQEQACRLLRKRLPAEVTLLGFVGAPFTLYTYATEGSHAGALVAAKTGLARGLFQRFSELLIPELLSEIELQAEGGAQAICLFDTAVGELSFIDFRRFIIPQLRELSASIKQRCPQLKIIYYSKHTHLSYLRALEAEHIDVLGIDWRVDLAQALQELGGDYFIQGNLDPCWLHLSWQELEANLQEFARSLEGCDRSRWIAGLGHGVLVGTPEENVRKVVQWIQNLGA